jgi:serine/threonine protein kinase/Flp pilus assembly protein TadD
MALTVGTRLGPYKILAPLGAGGMGEVYKARDTTLEREVAVKVLSSDAAGDSERFAYLRSGEPAVGSLTHEARMAAALNHPNICTIFEVGQVDGQIYIAMELVEGRPLNVLLREKALSVEGAVRYGAQIADALAHAHERGVVHRDLKSANVVITRAGRPKVLDFGLAKRLRTGDWEATRSLALTDTGLVAGTLPYMAPELLRGEPGDTRSDVWALGVVLYEMLARKLPFKGQTAFEISAAILHEPVVQLSSQLPPVLSAVIQHCLAKEPGERYQHAGEVRAALETLLPVLTVTPAPAGLSRRRWLWTVGGVAASGALATVWRLVPTSIFRSPTAALVRSKGSMNSEANEYFEKAKLFIRVQDDVTRGRQMLEKALELDPHFAEARRWLGFSYVLMIMEGHSNDTSVLYEAEKQLREASQEDPGLASVHSALAYVYFLEGRKELIAGEIEAGLKAAPEDAETLMALVQYHRFNGETARAVALAKGILQREPLFFPARMTFGNLLQMQGDTSGAIREEEKLLEQAPQSIAVTYFLSLAYFDAGELAKARAILEGIRALHLENYWVRVAWALLLALEAKRQAAVAAMDAEVQKFAAANVFVTLQAAEFFAVLGENAKALEWLERGVRNGDGRAEWFRRDRFLGSIRHDPRFQQILDSVTYPRSKTIK